MRTARFLITRLIALVVTLLLASLIIYGALYLAPGSPLSFLTRGRSQSPADIAAIKHEYRLDQPFLAQWWHWLTNAMHGNLGTSIIYHTQVQSVLSDRIGTTVFLLVYASVLILVIGLAVGIAAALRPGWVDASLMVGATAAMAIPAFVASIVLITVFAVGLGWFPVFGSGVGFFDRLWHLTLPAIALALAAVAYVARLSRTAVRAELASEHVQTATSRGLPYRLVVRRHVLRNAMVPIVTVAGLTIGSLIAGTVIVEQAFGLNGLGSYLVQAVGEKDFPVVQAICLLYVAAFIVINTLVDVVYSVLDPRVTIGRSPG